MNLTRQQLTLIGIFTLFLAPVLLVMLMQSRWWQYQPGGVKNHGHLVQPPQPLSLGLRDETANGPSVPGNNKWLLLYVLSIPCDAVCEQDITALRQIHKAAGREQGHLAIVLLHPAGPDAGLRERLDSIYPAFIHVTDRDQSLLSTLAAIDTGFDAGETGPAEYKTYILDPLHNVILAFEKNVDPNDIHKDLKRLLKWSTQES